MIALNFNIESTPTVPPYPNPLLWNLIKVLVKVFFKMTNFVKDGARQLPKIVGNYVKKID